MNIDELIQKAGRATPPPSLKQAVMKKIKTTPQERNGLRQYAKNSPAFVAGWFATAAALVIALRMVLPGAAEFTASEREEIAFYIEEITLPSTVGPTGQIGEYEVTSNDIATFVEDTVEEIFWLKGEENNA